MSFSWPVRRSYSPAQRLSLVTGPALEPITVPEAKDHLRILHSDEDDQVEALIAAARGHAERFTDRQFITATWKLTLDRFPCYWEPIELPHPPLLSVGSVKYRDTADVLQTWSSSEYVVDAPAGPYATTGRVYPKFDKVYPTTLDRPDAVEVEFTAGYGANPEAVPQQLRQAMLLLVGHWFENRETAGPEMQELPFAAEALLNSFTRPLSLIR